MTSDERTGRPGGDIARFGVAILLASAFGAVQVFVIPRRLDIVTYGQYRLFLLYVAYIGILHLGLADGAFLRWAGRPLPVIRADLTRIGQWLLAICTSWLVLGLIGGAIARDPVVRTFCIGLACAALAINGATLVGYALQAGGDFRGAGRVAVLPPGLFVAAMVFLPIHSLRATLVAYIAAYAVGGVAGMMRISFSASAESSTLQPASLGTMIRDGSAVLGANLTASLSQFGDRILVSVAVPITTFAVYGFASSVMVTATAATQTLSRVALSHAAREPIDGDRRAILLGGFYDLIATGFGVAMAGVPLFELMVSRLLPAYASALPIVRALVIGSPFWVAIHVVLVGTLQSYGLVRRQLQIELFGLVFVFVVCGTAVFSHAPLWLVAGGSTVSGIAAWVTGLLVVRRLVPASVGDPMLRFVPIVACQAAAVVGVLWLVHGLIMQTVVYVAVAAGPTIIAARATRRHGW